MDFCSGCSALFLDRGELFQLFRSEGHDCPPEAKLRSSFARHEGEVLRCPKCRASSLVPGAVEGIEVWHCTPCNGFLVDRALLLGEARAHDFSLSPQGFDLVGRHADRSETASSASYISQIVERLAMWARGPD